MDTVDSKRRSEIMSRIGPRDTTPELAVRRVAHQLGYRFRLHRKNLPGRPDLVFPRFKVIVFVHGCFWHRHLGCANCSTPKTRPEFWTAKFAATVARDRRNEEALATLGWKVLNIWECEAEDPRTIISRLTGILGGNRA
jgi:DNA mismatch endonuclease (patch repair protein)